MFLGKAIPPYLILVTLCLLALLAGCNAPAPTTDPAAASPTVIAPGSDLAPAATEMMGAAPTAEPSPVVTLTVGATPEIATTTTIVITENAASPTTPGSGDAVPSVGRFFARPATLPANRVVNRAASFADETGFSLMLDNPANPQDTIAIRGGTINPPPAFNGDPITIRGQTANTFSTGGGPNFFYEENGIAFAISAGLGNVEEVQTIAASLEFLDLAAWQAWLDTLP